MDEREQERIKRRYEAIKNRCHRWAELSDAIDALQGDRDQTALRVELCDDHLSALCKGLVRYPEKDGEVYADMKRLFTRNVRLLPQEENPYFRAVVCFYEGRSGEVLALLEQDAEERFPDTAATFTEGDFVYLYADPFKQAFPGFWPKMTALLRRLNCDPELPALSACLGEYYQCSSAEESAELLASFAAAHPGLSLPKELLGLSYVELKKWHGAIACFSQVKGKNVFLYSDDLSFYTAWCYGKLRQYGKEEEWYRSCLEEAPQYGMALNNLGYSLYRQRRYEEALEIFEQCLKEERDLSCAADNAVRTLLALGRGQAARELIAHSPCTVSADLRRKAEQAPAKDRPARTPPPEPEEETEQAPIPDRGLQPAAFSSEKALENELLAQLEAGQQIFGFPLKVYEREDDFYGQQYHIDGGKGIIDLLCEDEKGDLYVVELKKDSAYNDVYSQTRYYLDWVQKNMLPKGKRAYGVILMGSASPKLIEQVRSDPQIRLFEYKLSCAELK